MTRGHLPFKKTPYSTVPFHWALLILFVLSVPPVFADPVEYIWQLQFQNGHPENCLVAFTHVDRGPANKPALICDTRTDKGEWHSCISLPKGLLKAGKDYVVLIDYQVIDRSALDAYFYAFARSARLGMGADFWQKCHGEPGATDEAKLRFSPKADDYIINVGIHNQGALRIEGIKVQLGSDWTVLPLTSSVGDTPMPALPTGAQPFIVDPPSNPSGPVLNLADFGAVSDGNVPPVSGPDRNHAAFVAALAKCRELKASKLIVPKGIYRITSGQTISFDGLTDFTFDGGGSTFLYHQISGGAGMGISHCTRTVFTNFNLDWDWKIDPLASVGRVTKISPNTSYFEMRFETAAPLNPKRWETMNPLDEKLRAPGAGNEFGGFGPKEIEKLDAQTVRVWPTWPVPAKVGQLYLLRHYTFEKHAVVLSNNTHLSLQNVAIYSFPGEGFVGGGDQHHLELMNCRITYPPNERRSITTTADGFHVDQSQGFIRLLNCDFGYTGDDCVNIHDNIHSGVRRLDDHTLLIERIVPWACPYQIGDLVEIRRTDYSPTGFSGKVKTAMPNYKTSEVTLVFDQALPTKVDYDSILFNHRYNSHNCIIQNCYFHENRARGVLCNSADWLVEGNRFFHNQHSGMLLNADCGSSWSEGFGATNVVIRNNRFESENSYGAGDGAAISIGADNNGDVTRYPLLHDLLIEGNNFTEMPGPVIEATSFKNLVFRNNTIANLAKSPVAKAMRGCIRVELGSNIWVEDNQWTTQKLSPSPSLYFDSQTTTGIACHNNEVNN